MSAETAGWTEFWRRRSLRFWLVLCMTLALLPMLAAAGIGYALHDRDVDKPISAIARQEHLVLAPLEQLPLRLWEAVMALNDYRIDGAASHAEVFRASVTRAEAAFDGVLAAANGDQGTVNSIGAARRHWAAAVRQGTAVLGMPAGPDAKESPAATAAMESVEHEVAEASRVLAALHEDMAGGIEREHKRILHSTLREEAVAFVVSLVFMVVSVRIIKRTLVGSIDELLEGATRVAAGDRQHTVRVSLPPELRKVATAFNTMTEHIGVQERALAELARIDGLTGLFNRREFDGALAEEIRRSGRLGGSIGLIMIDIDHFKRVNDAFGHLGGDAVLRTVASAVRGCVRDVDRVFRYGGEELAVVLPGSDVDGTGRTAERIREHVAAVVAKLADGRNASVTVSAGTAVHPAAGLTADELIAAADAALYRSKANGRNRVTAAA